MPISLDCANCGKPIERFLSQVRENNFCSRLCFVDYKNKTGFYCKENHPQWNGGPIEKVCGFCNEAFSVRRSQAKRGRGKYCSKACVRNAKSVIKTCEVCGIGFRLKKSQDVNGNGRYCSLKCRSIGYINRGVFAGENHPKFKHGKSYSAEYVCRASHRRRVQIRANGGDYTLREWDSLCIEYDNRCLACGRSDVLLTVDHVVPVSKGGANDVSNLQPLCLSCNSSKGVKVIDYR